MFLDPPARDLPNEVAPTAAGQKILLAEVFAYAAGYVRNLPDFRCTQTTIRFDDDAGRQQAAALAALGDADTTKWRLQASTTGPRQFTKRDVMTAELMFVRGIESRGNVRRTSSTGADASTDLYSLQGLRTSGEFGGMIHSLFSAESDAQFQWRHWENVAGEKLAVLTFQVDRAHSDFFIDWCCIDNAVRHERVAYYGQAFVEPSSGIIRRLWWRAKDIPDAIPTRSSATLVEYAPVRIGSQSWICPVKGITLTETRSPLRQKPGLGEIRSLNETVFTDYRKFDVKSRLLPSNDGASVSIRPR
jgi:hypothetical protein